jgi:asparagine synthase (glutamine-hydrolysing)
MCAIFGVFNIKGDYVRIRKQIIKMLKRLQPRGPDATGVAHFQVGENIHHFLCHQRLSIVDPFHGDQPFFGQSKKVCCVANGEIYNHFQVNYRNNNETLFFFLFQTLILIIFEIIINNI